MWNDYLRGRGRCDTVSPWPRASAQIGGTRAEDCQEHPPHASSRVQERGGVELPGLQPSRPREPAREARTERNRPKPWTIDELAAWLRVALDDRFAGMWVLAATTGMRLSELAGAERDMLDLDRAMLTIENTRVVVKGHAADSDGKTEGSRRIISLDRFTVGALCQHVEMIDSEREAFGASYPDHGKLMCFADGRRLHPDTVTSRFNRLVDKAGVRRIRLHDVRHTYATLARDLGVNSKIVTDRLGHANESVTQQIYAHKSIGQDRAAAEMIAGRIEEALRANLRAHWSRSWSHGNENGPPDHFRRAVLPGSGGRI